MSIYHFEPPENFDPKFEIAVCFIENGGKILFIQRQEHENSPNQWCLPGGGVHEDESVLQCVMREIKEETDIDLPKADLKFLRKMFLRHPDYGDYSINEFYVKFDQKPEVKVNVEEHKDFKWVTPDEAFKLDLIRGGDEGLKIFVEKDWA